MNNRARNSQARFFTVGLVIVIACYSSSAISHGSIYGQVRDQASGRPIPFALISVNNCDAVNASNDGSFIIDCPADSYTVEISADNYQTYSFERFYLGDNQFVNKDVRLYPIQGYSSQPDYPVEHELTESGQSVEGQASKTGRLLGELLGSKAGDRLDDYVREKQQRDQPVDQYGGPHGIYSGDEYYYPEGGSNEIYYSDEYYQPDTDVYYDAETGEYYYSDYTDTEEAEYYEQDYISDEGSLAQPDNSVQPLVEPGKTSQQARPTETREQVKPNIKDTAKPEADAGMPAVTGGTKPQAKPRPYADKKPARPHRAESRHKKQAPVVIGNKTAVYLEAGGDQTKFILMGKGLDQVNSISVVNPKGILDKNIIVKHDNKSSASQKTIYISATSKAHVGAGYYRLRLHVNNRSLTVHPGKIRIVVEKANRSHPGDIRSRTNP